MSDLGAFIAVVGPSGSGKDTILRGAMVRFADNKNVMFPRRIISRPADSANEDHIVITPEAFSAREAAGAFLLSWHAHGLCYALPGTVRAALDLNRVVVANLSRAALDRLQGVVSRVQIVAIEADTDIIRQRLMARRRETPAEIEARIRRAAAVPFRREKAIIIDNNGAPQIAIDRLCAIIEAFL